MITYVKNFHVVFGVYNVTFGLLFKSRKQFWGSSISQIPILYIIMLEFYFNIFVNKLKLHESGIHDALSEFASCCFF